MANSEGSAALDEVEFLARSPNRLRVLEHLVDGPIGRYELEEAAGVSRATLGRILEDFDARGWVSEHDRAYRTTQLGTYVAREFAGLLQRFEPVPALNEVAEWFPETGFGFDLGCLAGATVVRPSKTDVLAPTNYISDRVSSADRVRLLTYSVLPDIMDVCLRGTVEGRLDLESVLNWGALDHLATDPAVIERAQAFLESDRSEIVIYEGDIPTTVFVVDGSVLLCLSGGDGAPHAVIDTDDATVLAWAEETIDRYRQEGEILEAGQFTSG